MLQIAVPAPKRRAPTHAEMRHFVAKSLGFDGFETDGLGLWDLFGAPGNSAMNGSGYRDVEQIRGWNHTAILAKSLQFALANMTVFCSREIADLVSAGRIDKYKAASRTSGIEHFQVPEDWVQAPREYRITKLLHRPNPWTDESLFRFRISQQIEAHGVCYILVLPNEEGVPSQLYVIPKTMLSQLPPTQRMPRGGYRTTQLARYLRGFSENRKPESLQEMLQWLSNKDFDARYIIPIGLPSFVWMDDFLNPSAAIADALDTDKEIHRSRRQTLQNQMTNGPMLEEEAGYTLQNDERMQLMEEFYARNAGPGNAGKPFWKPKGVNVHNGAYSAREMEFSDSAAQARDDVMGQRMTPSAMVGLGDMTSYASVIGVLKAWSRMSGQPLMRLCAGQLTVGLQQFYPDNEERDFMVVMQAGNIDDPETKLSERRLALESGTRTVKEWREEDNLEPFGDDRDDAIVGTLQSQPPAGAEGEGGGLAGLLAGAGGGGPQGRGSKGGDKGPEQPGVGAALPGAGTGAGGAAETEKSAPGMAGLTRAQFKRNRTAILETLDAVESGQMRPQTARAMLQALGLNTQEAEEMIRSVTPENPQQGAEPVGETAASFFAKLFAKGAAADCGANGPGGGGFQPGNTCGKGDGGGVDHSSDSGDKPQRGKSRKAETNVEGKAGEKRRKRHVVKDQGASTRGRTPEEVAAIKRRQRAAGRRAALTVRIQRGKREAEERGETPEEHKRRIRANMMAHQKRRLQNGEINELEYKRMHDKYGDTPYDEDEVASWSELSAAEKFDVAIDKASAENEVDWSQLRQVAEQVWRHHAEFHRIREAGKKEARRMTGLTLAKISEIENEGRDYSTVPDFDELARDFAMENPLVGIDPDDAADAVWQLIREPQQKMRPKYDPDIIDDAVGIIQRGEAIPGPKQTTGGSDDFVPAGERDDFVPATERDDFVPEYEMAPAAADDDDLSWNFGKATRRALFAKWAFELSATWKSADCGANGPGGGGFQPGNTCGKRDGSVSDSAADEPKATAGTPKLQAIGERLSNMVHQDGGFTYHQPTDTHPKRGFALSILPGREVKLDRLEDMTPDVVVDFLLDNMDIFESDERAHVGAWYNLRTPDNPEGDDKVYLDVSIVVDDHDEAYAMAREYGQLGMFDLENFKTIKTMTDEERAEWERKQGLNNDSDSQTGKGYEVGRFGGRGSAVIAGIRGREENDARGSRRSAEDGREENASAEDVRRWLRSTRAGKIPTDLDFLE